MSIGGDPSGVEAAAAALRAAGSGFTDAADDIASHARGLRAEWIGEASDAAHDALIGLSIRTRVGHDVAVGAAAVLEQYARSLRSAQSTYDAASDAQASAATAQQSAGAALSVAQGASGQVGAGTTTATSVGAEAPAVATASAAVAAADQAATAAADSASDAVAAAAAADQLAAAAIDALVEQLPAMRGASAGAPDRRGQSQGSHASSDHDGSWWGGAWSWTTEHASDISAVAGTAAAVTAFIPGVDVIATPLLMGVAVASGALATDQDVAHGENGQAVQDGAFTILNAVPGAGAVKVLSKLDDAAQLLKASGTLKDVPFVVIDGAKHPESALHAAEAQAAGHPKILTVDRAGASRRRAESLAGIPTKGGLDRDEYPPALFAEGGEGASVKHIPPPDNRGAGASLGHQLRGLPNGNRVKLIVVGLDGG